jgi:hypothetical protein
MIMSKIIEALKRRYRSPKEVLHVLGLDASAEEIAKAHGKLNKQEKATASPNKEHREEMPESAFLEPERRKYPVKVKRDGKWHYSRNLLLAAERRAIMNGHHDIAKRAKEIREREFPDAHDSSINILKGNSNMTKLSYSTVRALAEALKQRGLLAMDTSIDEAVRVMKEAPEDLQEDSRKRRSMEARARALDAKRRAAEARKAAADARAHGDWRRALDEEIRASEADLDADRWEDAEADDIDPNSGLPIYIDMEDPEEPIEEKEIEDALLREDEHERREDEESEDRRHHFEHHRFGRDEDDEDMPVRGAQDKEVRRALEAYRRARDERRRAADEVRRHAADLRRAEDDLRRALEDRRRAEDARRKAMDERKPDEERRAEEEVKRAEDAYRRAEEARKHARDARKRAVHMLKRAHDTILTTGMDIRKRVLHDRKDEDDEMDKMTKKDLEEALRARDRLHKQAMDEAIKRERERSIALQNALRVVRPYVGDLAMDAAATSEDVYRTSLKILGVSTDGVHPSAYAEMFKLAAQAKMASRTSAVGPRLAHDSVTSGVPSFESMFPDAANIRNL